MTILVTGGTGCIGANTVHQLLSTDVDRIVVTSRNSDPTRIAMWQGCSADALDARLQLVSLDLSNESAMQDLLQREKPTHILHLAALQSPACDADAELGMRINVGTVMSLLRSADRNTLQRFVFASSGAVYGKRAFYPQATIAENAQLAPPNLYGVWKLASENLCRLFHEQTSIPTVCLRLNTTYGPGRDLGKTAAPTAALRSIARNSATGKTQRFAMPYDGRENYHYVGDVGAHFAGCAMQPFDGFAALNIKGKTIAIKEFLQTAQRVAERLGVGKFCELGIADDAEPNLFVCDLEDSLIDAYFDELPRTPIEEGIELTLKRFLKPNEN